MDTDSFRVNIENEDVYKDIANEVEKRFDTSNFVLERSLSISNNKKVTGLMKDELGGKIMTEFVGVRLKTFSYIINDGSGDNKAKVTKKCQMQV